ncbi:MAG: Gfo/Idh/MocA family protein [Prolixibacteraceae bacterium]
MQENIKFVIIGSGNIANTYARAIQKIEHAEIVGIVSTKLNKLANFTHLPSFHNLHEIELNFDAVIICTPNGYHHINAIEAAGLGKHVLCEKPIDITLESIDKMIQSCKENNVKLGVAYQRRFSSDNPIVKKLIDEQMLGKIFSVDLAVKNYRDDNYYNSADYRGTYSIDGGGPFIQQASHYIDLYYWFFGQPTRLVSQLGTFVHNIEVEDHGAAICLHDSGMIGTITASTATKPGFPAKMEIYTSKGFLILENDVITHWDIEGLKNPTKQESKKNTHTGASTASVEDTSNHEFILKDFIDAIKTGKEALISGESARNATEIILDIYNNQF